jgi:hypothetical protein
MTTLGLRHHNTQAKTKWTFGHPAPGAIVNGEVEMADLILDLLNSAKLRARVVKTLADTCCLAKTIHDNPPGDMKDLEGGELWEEA